MRRIDRELTDKEEIESIISLSDVCRIALANDNIPYIVTMNFGYVGGENQCMYFHCALEGRKLEMILINNYACFEMDTNHKINKGEKGCDWGMNYSSIIGYGKVFIVEDKDERYAGLCHIMDHYGGSEPYFFDENVFAHTTILRLDIIEITGKKKQ